MPRIIIPADVERLASQAVAAAFCIHKEFGPGLLESAYEACFVRELETRGIPYQRQVPIPLRYQGTLLDIGFRADVVMDGRLLVELKAVENMSPLHKAQVITYLKIMKLPLGLLINFDEVLIKNGITRVLNIPKT